MDVGGTRRAAELGPDDLKVKKHTHKGRQLTWLCAGHPDKSHFLRVRGATGRRGPEPRGPRQQRVRALRARAPLPMTGQGPKERPRPGPKDTLRL